MTIIAPKRSEKWTVDGLPTTRLAETIEELARVVNTLSGGIVGDTGGGAAGGGGGAPSGGTGGGGVGTGGGGGGEPPTNRIAIPGPHWEYLAYDMTYNYVELGRFTAISFANAFGLPIETRSGFQEEANIGAAGKAVLVRSTTPNQFMTIVGSTTQDRGSIVLTDSDGDIVDWCYLSGSPAVVGISVRLPSDGLDHYLVLDSDTTKLRVRMWTA